MAVLSIDIETRSDVDLRDAGVYRYVEGDEFKILIFAYAWDDEPVIGLDLLKEEIPKEVIEAIDDPEVEKRAFNAAFERIAIGAHLGRTLDPTNWKCTMVQASECGIMGNLDSISRYLNTGEEKDKTGKTLIRWFSVPHKTTGDFKKPEDEPEKWQAFIDYCVQDVETERSIAHKLNKIPIPDFEWETYELDQRINDRGVLIDRDLAQGAVDIMKDLSKKGRARMEEITKCDNVNSVAQLKEWLATKGYDVKSLNKANIKKLLSKDDLDSEVREVLELRTRLSNASIKKYQKMLTIACKDGRAKGTIQFYGATRTGRYAGRLIQVQNLPRNKMDGLSDAREIIKTGDLETAELIYDNVPDVIKQLIRTALVAEEGKTFYVSDFSAIEARVTAWYAGEQWRLDVFEGDGRIYEASAAQMFHMNIDDVDSEMRQRGKVAELALGYQGGVGALKTMGAIEQGLKEEELQPIVDAWRKASPNIVKFWYAMQDAAIRAVRDGELVTLKKYKGLRFYKRKGILFIELPSGRRLAYPKARMVPGKFGDQVGFDGYGRNIDTQDSTYGGKLVENIVQATARDLLNVGLKNLEEAGYDIVFHVHDEAVIEAPTGGSIEPINDILGEPVEWAKGLPLGADGYITPYYKKD